MIHWNLLQNTLSVGAGALAVYCATPFPMIAITLAFASGVNVALSARLDIAIVRE